MRLDDRDLAILASADQRQGAECDLLNFYSVPKGTRSARLRKLERLGLAEYKVWTHGPVWGQGYWLRLTPEGQALLVASPSTDSPQGK